MHSTLYTLRNLGLALLSVLPAPFALGQEKPADPKIFERLSGGIQYRTVSYDDQQLMDSSEFLGFQSYLQKSYPLVHAHMKREIINRYSLLYTWQATSTSMKPALFMAHLDVVPVEPGTEQEWEHGAFSGAITDSHVWGRGTMDVKFSLFAMLESAEELLKDGYMPNRTILFAFGHDEEAGGRGGAMQISSLLAQRYGRLEFVVDEGGGIAEGLFPGVDAPIAAIAIAEKGYVTLELSTNGHGGHSSAPSENSQIGNLCNAVARLEKKYPRYRITSSVRLMLAAVSAGRGSGQKIVLRSTRFFAPLIKLTLKQNDVTRAMLTTTVAPTIFSSGLKENVLPGNATATVNFRILPGHTIEDVVARVGKITRRYGVDVQVLPAGANPATITDIRSQPYKLLTSCISSVFPEAITVPVMNVAYTDSRYFNNLTSTILRFVPLEVHASEVHHIHGVGESISKENYLRAIKFYSRLIGGAGLPDELLAEQ